MKKIKALIPILGLSLLTSCSLEDRMIFGGNKILFLRINRPAKILTIAALLPILLALMQT